MQIIIKVLKGKDCYVDVSPTSTIHELKLHIAEILKIPASNQKLLLLGRPLSDDQQISSYSNLKEGTKLNLIVMKPESLRDAVYRSFRKYYVETMSDRLTTEFMADFDNKMIQLSLDDIELFCENLHNG